MAAATATRLCLLRPAAPGAAAPLRSGGPRVAATAAAAAAVRAIHSNPPQPAKVVPVYGAGPPPEPPQLSEEFAVEERNERIARRRRQAEMLKLAGDMRAGITTVGSGGATKRKGSGGLKKRFWKDVHVREVNGALEIHLDNGPLRHPTTKAIIRLPPSKPHLAHALALEWDNLVSVQQATKQHLIPLTSLICRALDIASDDASSSSSSSSSSTTTLRATIAATLLRYLDTDSLLCFFPSRAHSPSPASHSHSQQSEPSPSVSLPTLQHQAYASTVSFLAAGVWPGVRIVPVLDDASPILPRRQPSGTRDVVHGWVLSLSPFELAGLERATLAGKSLLAAARLVAEWSEEGARAGAGGGRPRLEEGGPGGRVRFGVEEAARVANLEVDWQTGRWGEVEDTHDVDREDLRRQFGSAVLLVSGTGSGTAGSKS